MCSVWTATAGRSSSPAVISAAARGRHRPLFQPLLCFYYRKTSWTPSSRSLDLWKPSNCVRMLLMLMLTLVKGGPENPRVEFWLVLAGSE